LAHQRSDPGSPDVAILAAEWQPRALIRAQLIEQGFEVVSTDTWPMMQEHLAPGVRPRLALVDLKGLPDPTGILRNIGVLMEPDRVLVLTAMGTVTAADVRRLGFRALARPIVIEDVVRTVAAALLRDHNLEVK
jgi:hypothetical protein